MPSSAAGVEPLLILGGLACLVLVDLLACSLRRVPLAGLPLLVIYTIPVSMTGVGVSWWVFAVVAGGFALMLFLQESEQLSRWGRTLGSGCRRQRPLRLRGPHRRRAQQRSRHRRAGDGRGPAAADADPHACR